MPQNYYACEPQLLSLHATTDLHAWSLCSATREAIAMRSLCTTTREQPPLTSTRESLHAAMKTHHSQNVK